MKLSDLFNVTSGSGLDFNKMSKLDWDTGEETVNFVSRSSKNLGIVARVKKMANVEPFAEGLITVTLGGTYLLSAFIQPSSFYTAQNIAVLSPKQEMTFKQKLYYCLAIRKNRYRYSAFGREANRTIKVLDLPDAVPAWINDVAIDNSAEVAQAETDEQIELTERKWMPFAYSQLFEITQGTKVRKRDLIANGRTPLISALSHTNGFAGKVDLDPEFDGNVITVNNNGNAGVGLAFYQPIPFCATIDVNVLKPLFELNSHRAMFLVTLIRQERYRFSFGRKWKPNAMKNSSMLLPVNTAGDPDWHFVEDYIKSLPYSKTLVN